jgi:hypothetical protein
MPKAWSKPKTAIEQDKFEDHCPMSPGNLHPRNWPVHFFPLPGSMHGRRARANISLQRPEGLGAIEFRRKQ